MRALSLSVLCPRRGHPDAAVHLPNAKPRDAIRRPPSRRWRFGAASPHDVTRTTWPTRMTRSTCNHPLDLPWPARPGCLPARAVVL